MVRTTPDNQQERLGDYLRMLAIAESMNGDGRYRKERWSNRILRGHTPDTDLEP